MTRYFSAFITILLISACASLRNSLPGGDEDTDPPVMVNSDPDYNAINFKGEEIEIEFNEFIGLDDVNEKFTISPPMEKRPEIRDHLEKIRVIFKEELQDSTTYTLDFGNAVQDFNEGNKIDNFVFTFSTGQHIDSLQISGVLKWAKDRKPVDGAIVSIYESSEDSMFQKHVPLRITKTNEFGEFTVRNIKHGNYALYALKDLNRNFFFDQPGEGIAFIDSMIMPSAEWMTIRDTFPKSEILEDSVSGDTVVAMQGTVFYPHNLQLFLFEEDYLQQDLSESDRSVPYKLDFTFEKIPDSVHFDFLNEDTIAYSPDFIRELNTDKKLITLWLKDSNIYKMDTLVVDVSFPQKDPLDVVRLLHDTVKLTYDFEGIEKALAEKRKKEERKGEAPPKEFMNINVYPRSAMEIYDRMFVVFEEPLGLANFDSLMVYELVDTIQSEIDYEIEEDSLNPRKYYIDFEIDFSDKFSVEIDSAAFQSIYGKENNKIRTALKVRPEDYYGSLKVRIIGLDTTAILQVLGSGKEDKVIEQMRINGSDIYTFPYLEPNKYKLKLIYDWNDNGMWDTGDFSEKRKPEKVIYFNSLVEIRANWTIDQTWNVNSVVEYVEEKENEENTNRNRRRN